MSGWQEATDSISIATGAAYCYVYKDWRIKKIKPVSEKQVLCFLLYVIPRFYTHTKTCVNI